MRAAACSCPHTQRKPQSLQDPVPNIRAEPDPANILEWHFVILGEAGTPYAGGTYHGKLLFPSDYPFKPPGILMLTPSGRFVPGNKICFSFSDFHPEAWNPIWHVATILNATVSFMNEDTLTTGCTKTSLAEKRRLAGESLGASCKNPAFRRMFPDLLDKHKAAQAAGTDGEVAGCSGAEGQSAAGGGAVEKEERREVREGSWLQAQLAALRRVLPTIIVAALAIGIVLVQYRSAVK